MRCVAALKAGSKGSGRTRTLFLTSDCQPVLQLANSRQNMVKGANSCRVSRKWVGSEGKHAKIPRQDLTTFSHQHQQLNKTALCWHQNKSANGHSFSTPPFQLSGHAGLLCLINLSLASPAFHSHRFCWGSVPTSAKYWRQTPS